METTNGSFRNLHPHTTMPDEPSFFRQKPQNSTPIGQGQEAVDATPSELNAPIQRPAPVWKTFVQNSEFQEANRAGIAAEHQQMRAARRTSTGQGDIFKGVNGRLIHKARGAKPVEYDANEWTDDPIAGPEARKALWDREIRTSREEAEMTNLELANPAFHAQEVKDKDREAMLAEGSMLAETDPRHVKLKSKLKADDDYRAKKADMAQRAWNAKARAAQLETMDPEAWWQERQAQPAPAPSEQRQATVAAAQDTAAQGHAADQQAAARDQEITAKLQGGVSGEESKALLAERAEIAAHRAKIAEVQAGSAKQVEGVQAEAKAATPPKDFINLGDTVSGIWDAVKGLGTSAPAAFYQLMEGMDRPDQYSDSAKAAFAEADAWNKEMQAKTATNQAAGTSSSVGESFREAGGSLGFSLGSMAAAIPASIGGAKAGAVIGGLAGAPAAGVGAAPGAAIGATIGGVAAGMAASGTAAYRMAGASFLNEAWQQLQAASQEKSGRPMNEAEMASAYEALIPIAQNTALWEAGPEAVGNAVTAGAGKIIFGLGKPLAAKFTQTLGKKVATKVAAGAGSLATELAGETVTNIEQSADQKKATAIAQGQDPNAIKADWSAGGIVESFKQVAPQTLALMGLMAGAGGGVKIASKLTGIGDYSKDSKNAAEMLEGVNAGLAAIDPTATVATPDEMHTAAFIARPTDGPAELAEAIIIQRELAIIAEEDAGILPAAQEALAQAQASTDKGAIKVAETALEQAAAAPQRAPLVTATLKIAAGQQLNQLTAEELTAVGYESKPGKAGKDGQPAEIEFTPIKQATGKGTTPAVAPMIRQGADGSIILTDAALKAVGATSPRAAARIAMSETEAIGKANERAEAAKRVKQVAPGHYEYTTPDGNTGSIQLPKEKDANAYQQAIALASGKPSAPPPAAGPANSTTPPAGGSGAAAPNPFAIPGSNNAAPSLANTFDVPMRDGTMMRVQAPNAEEALRVAAGTSDTSIIAGTPAVPVQPTPTDEKQTDEATGAGTKGPSAKPGKLEAFREGATGKSPDVDVLAKTQATVAKARAIVEKAKKNKSLGARLIEGGDRAETRVEGIAINSDVIIREALDSGMNEKQALQYFTRVLDEEVRHLAQYDAAAILFKMAGGKGDFLAWMESHYAGIWAADFAGTAKEATVRDLYLRAADGDAAAVQARWDGMTDANKALEAIRMMSQGKNVTEQAKLWANISTELKNALRAALAALKKFADTASPEILQEIKNLENALSQLTGTPNASTPNAGNRPEKQDRSGQDTGTPQPAEAASDSQPASAGGIEPGGLEAPVPSAWVGKRVAFIRAGEALQGEVSFADDTKRGPLLRIKLDAPDASGTPTRAIFIDEMKDATGEMIGGFKDLSPPPAEASEWEQFPPESGTLGIPRAEMPQVGSGDRSALLQFLRARGIDYREEEIKGSKLKPTQAEWSPAKVAKIQESRRDDDYTDRALLVSKDNHLVDGHHQWLAAQPDVYVDAKIRIIRLLAPIEEILLVIHEMPSVETSEDSSQSTPQDTAEVAEPPQEDAKPTNDGENADVGEADFVDMDQSGDSTEMIAINPRDRNQFPGTDYPVPANVIAFQPRGLDTEPLSDQVFTFPYDGTAEDAARVGSMAFTQMDRQFSGMSQRESVIVASGPDGMTKFRLAMDSVHNEVKVTTVGTDTFAADMEAQAQWFVDQAENLGYQSLDELNEQSPETFVRLAEEWRAAHPRGEGNDSGSSTGNREGTQSEAVTPAPAAEKWEPATAETVRVGQRVRNGETGRDLGTIKIVHANKGYGTLISTTKKDSNGKSKSGLRGVEIIAEAVETPAAKLDLEVLSSWENAIVESLAEETIVLETIKNMPSNLFAVIPGKIRAFLVARMNARSMDSTSYDYFIGNVEKPAWVETVARDLKAYVAPGETKAKTDSGIRDALRHISTVARNNNTRDAITDALNVARKAGIQVEYKAPADPMHAETWFLHYVDENGINMHRQLSFERGGRTVFFGSEAEKAPAVAEPAAPVEGLAEGVPAPQKIESWKITKFGSKTDRTAWDSGYRYVTAMSGSDGGFLAIDAYGETEEQSIEKAYRTWNAKHGKRQQQAPVATDNQSLTVEPAAAPVDPALEAARAKARAVLDGLFAGPLPSNRNALRAAQLPKGFTQEIPAERFMPLMEAASAMVQAGVNTPEALAAEMDALAADRKAVPFVQAFWFALKAAGAKGKAEPKWAEIYAKIDKAAEEAQISTEEQSDEQTQRDGNSGSATDVGTEESTSRPGEGADTTLDPSAGGDIATGGLRPGQPDGSGRGDLPGGSVPGSDGNVVGAGDNDGTPQGNSGSGSSVAGEGVRNATRPELGSPEANFVIEDGFSMPKGEKARIAANLKAIALLREIEAQGRDATLEEKKILSAYSGWGSFKNAFNRVNQKNWTAINERLENASPYYRDNIRDSEAYRELSAWRDKWGELFDTLDEMLSPEEFRAMSKSIRNAHFTALPIIDSMWNMVRAMGFKGGNVLETSVGAGYFVGRQPVDMANVSKWSAVELDSITARVFSKLYPEARINGNAPDAGRVVDGQGFQKSKIPNNSQDLVIGNFPFAKDGPMESLKEFGRKLNLHNYFFARSIDKLKPGGILIAITSNSTMDNNIIQRELIAGRVELVQAIRLPNDAFKENAGTEVTTDILILRKKDGSRDAESESWTNVESVGEDTVYAKQGAQSDHAFLSEISPDWVPVDEDLQEPWKEWRAKKYKSGVKWDLLTSVINNHRYGSQGIPFRAKMVVNEYFARHPEAVIGRHALEGSMYSAGSYAVVSDGVDVQARLDEIIKNLPSDLFEESELGLYSEPETIEASAQHRNGSIVLVNDQPHHVIQGELVPVRWDLEYTEDFLADAKEVKAVLAGNPELKARFAATFDTLNGNMLANWIDGFIDEHLTPETAKKIRDKIAKEVARRNTVFKSWVKVRDSARALMDAELRGDPAGELYREALNQSYDAHVAEHGAFSARSRAGSQNPHKFLFDEDDSPLLESLEDEVLTGTDDKGKPIYRYEKRPIFTESMVSSATAPTTAKDIKEAVGTSMGYKGRISLKYMASLLKVSKDEAAKQLAESGLAFKNPKSGLYETADFYLSGEVRAKLREAEEAEAFEPGIYRSNIEALTKIIPENRPIQAISVILGNRWLPGVIYSKFAEEKLGMDTPEVRYEPASNGFKIKTADDSLRGGRRRNRSERDARAEDPDYMGTAYMPPNEIFEYILNSREIRIMKAGPTRGSTVVDAEATIEAQTKADQMMDKFAEWVKTSKDEVEFEGKTYRISDLAEQEFNDKVAGLVTPTYVGEWVTLPGQSGEIWLKPHRKAVLARLLTMGYGMMAHGVGSGKTYNQIALAMELRRLGKARRVVTIVQNSTIRQFAASHMKAYPHAKILVADEENFSARKRARFLAKIATGDYDSIIMTHSNISQIGHDEQSIRNYMARAIGEMEEVLAAAEAGSQQQGDIQAALDQLQEKLENLLAKATSRAGSVLTWEQLGVDALIVDEAHEFKNAPIITRKERIKNLPASGTASDRAVMMQMKTRSVQSMTGGKNIFFATGTPITNTMAEAYTMINFIAPHILESKNINNFDDFATMFGRTVSEPEATWRGAIEMVERFAKFVNGPELVALIRSVFDVALGNENLGIRVPRIKGGGPEMLIVEPTEASEIFNDWVIDTAAEFDGIQNKRQAFQENPWMQAIPIMIMQAGMAQAIDPRLINPMAPDDPASKVNQLVARMIDIYKDGTERKTAQVVFTDLSNPFSTLLLKQFNGDPFAEYGDVTPEMADLEAQIMAAPTETPAEKKAKAKLVNRLSELAEKRFSLMDDIKQKLIAADIPASEIFLANSSINPKKLKASFDKVNSGEIRIIIGSTARLGTGVNIQERLAAAHNLSPPRDFKPAMMEQRIGRIERQGNLHRDWADQALVHVVQKMAKISFDAKKLEDRYEMAIDWLEKNGTDKQKEIARKAEAQFEIIVINYGLKFSMDSSVYSMMKAKQKFIDQVLMGENVTDEFDDPMSAESNAFALMAAEAMGDENLKRRVILDGELNKLTALRSAYVRDKQNRENALDRAKGDISSLTRQDPDGIRAEGKKFAGLYGRKKRIVKTTKGTMDKASPGYFGKKLTAEQEKEPWEREVEAPVYRFADQEIDTAKPDQTITKPLNIFIADAMVDAKDTKEIVTRDITVNGERFVFAVSHYKRFGEDDYSARIVWPGKVAGRVVFESYVNVSGESPASSLLDGLKKLSSPDYAEKYASNIEREIAMHQQTVATLEPLVANPRPFAEEQEWREKSRESIEVNRLLAQANSDPRKHRYFRSLSRMVGEDATEQILGIDGKEGLPNVAPDVWNRMFVRFRLDRRGIANNPAAIAKRLRDVVDADTGQAAAEASSADAEGSDFDAAAAANPIARNTPRADSTPDGFMFPSSRYRKQDGRLATLRGIQEKLATKLEALEARDMYGRELAQKREHAAKIETAKKPLEKIRAEIAKIESAKYQETMRGESTPLRAGPLPAQVIPGSSDWMAMDKDERIATLKRQKSVAREYLAAIKAIFHEDLGTDDGLKDVPEINANPVEMIREIRHLVGITVRGMQPLRAGPLPAATDYERFPAEWNSLNVPRAEMPQVPSKERPAFLQFLQDAGVKVTDEQMKPTAITPIQIEYFPAKVERAKGIPAERRVFVSADGYLLDGHHQWMAQRGRDTVNVTRIGLPVREAIATMFLFPGTEKREGGQALNAGPLPAPDPRLVKEFGENFEADEYGMPVTPRTLPDGHPLLEVTWPSGEQKKFRKKIATMPADHVLVKGLDPADKRAKGLPADHPAIRGGWLPAGDVSRRDFARAVVNFFLSFGTELAADQKGVAYATGGGGGAGKSSILELLEKWGQLDPTGAVLVNADDIKEMIPEFELLKGFGDGRAAATVHEESSHIAQLLQDALLKPGNPRFNFIFDGTLANKDKSITKMNQWKAAGYSVHLVGVTVEPYEAMVRAVLRGKGSGRWVPTSELAKAHLSFNKNLPELMEAADRVNVFDNTPPLPHEVAKKTNGEDTISIVNQEYFEKIKLREDERTTKPTSQSQTVPTRSDGQGSGRSEESGRGINGESQGSGGPLQSQGPLTSARLDADYSAAVESGDMRKALRMVYEAAKAAGWAVTIKQFSGETKTNSTRFEPTSPQGSREEIGDAPPESHFGPFFHGSRSDEGITEFDTRQGAYFTTDESYAEGFREVGKEFGAKNPPMYRVFLRVNSPQMFDGNADGEFDRFTSEREASAELSAKGFDGQVLLYDGEMDIRVNDPSQIKSADPVTRDAQGKVIPLSQRFNAQSDSILRAGPVPTPEPSPVFRYKVPVNPALVEEAKGEREGFGKNMASGKLAGFGSDRTRAEQDAIDAVYEFTRTVQKNADTMKVAREMLARDPQDIERKLLDSVTDKDFNLTPADHLAIQLMIDRKTQEAGNDPNKLAENGARMMAYRIMRGDAGRLLQIGYDRFLTPAERNLAAITDAIFTPTRKIQKVIASKPIAERAAFIRAAAEARVKTVEAELAKAGLSIAEITRKSDKLALEKSQLMKDVLKLRKTLDQNILGMIQRGATKADIKRRYGAEAADQAQQVLSDARADLKAKIAPMVQAGMTMAEIVAKLGALQAGPIGNAAAPLSPEAIAAEIERILAEGFGMPAVLAEKPALPRPKAKPVPAPVPKGSTPVPTAPTAINSDWSRPVINEALSRYTFDTKDRSGIMTRVENIRMLAGAVGSINKLDAKKQAEALALLAEIDKTLAKYGTDTNTLLAEVHAGKHIDDFRFDINDVQHVASVARIISTMDADWIDKASEVLYANMLSGLQTMVVNATAIVPAAWEATVGRGFEMAINVAVGDPLAPQAGELKYILKALKPAWTRAVSNFVAGFNAQHPMFDRDVLNQQPDIERVMGGKGYRMGGSISGKKGDIVRIPSRLLMATDDFNMTLFTMADVGAYAFRFVKSQGFKPGTPQFDKEMRIQINTPGSESYILAATRYKRAIFSNPLPGEKDPVTGKTVPVHGLGDMVGEWAAKLNGALTKEHDSMFIKLTQTLAKISFFPFQRVPFNILRKGIRYTPNPVSLFDIGLGMIQNSRTTGPNGETVWEWNANKRNTELIERMGMQLQGAALLTLLIATGAGEGDDDDLKKSFLITGSMPFTPQGRAEREAQTRSGLGPSRISFRRADGSERFGFNYGRLEPLATTLAATIDTVKEVKRAHRSGKDNYDAAAEALGGLVAQAKDKSFLRGVSDLMALVTNAMAEPDLRENRKLQQYLAGRVAMVIPNIIKQPLRETDNLYRERSNDFMQEVLYQVAPIGQKSPKVDPWGEQAEKAGFAATRIFDVTDMGTDKPHPVDQMLIRWRDSGKWSKAADEADRKPWFPAPIANSTFKNPITGQTVKMDEAQLAEFREKAGKATAAKLRGLSLNYESPTITDIDKVRKTVTESRAAIKAALAFKFSKTAK